MQWYYVVVLVLALSLSNGSIQTVSHLGPWLETMMSMCGLVAPGKPTEGSGERPIHWPRCQGEPED